MCKGFNHFSDSLHHFVLAKLATSITWVKPVDDRVMPIAVFRYDVPPGK